MPQFWKGASNGHRLRYALPNNEQRECDLVFLADRAFAILEWSEAGAATVSVELDPAKLRAADPGGRVYDYSEALTDPR